MRPDEETQFRLWMTMAAAAKVRVTRRTAGSHSKTGMWSESY